MFFRVVHMLAFFGRVVMSWAFENMFAVKSRISFCLFADADSRWVLTKSLFRDLLTSLNSQPTLACISYQRGKSIIFALIKGSI